MILRKAQVLCLSELPPLQGFWGMTALPGSAGQWKSRAQPAQRHPLVGPRGISSCAGWPGASPFDFRRFRQALRPEGGAEVHFGDLGEALGALLRRDFLGRRIHRSRGAFREFRAELLFQGAKAGDEFVPGQD